MAVVGAIAVGVWQTHNVLTEDYAFARTSEEVQTSRQDLQKVEDLATVYRAVAKAVGPSVVKIDVVKKARREPSVLRRFFQEHPGMIPDAPGGPDNNLDPDNAPNSGGPDDELQEEIGEGSGVVMQVDGSTVFILTNNHVAGGASDVRVTLADGRTFDDAKVVGTDPKSDLAVVKIQADHVIPAQWGDSDQLQQGDMILAFGSPFGYVGSMTHGIVSALNRDHVDIIPSKMGYENFIQVDAPINPGNSGGPLVNLHGEVVGINTAIASRTGGFQGIGFAIPSDEAHSVFDALRDKGKVVRGYLGVEILNVADARDEAKSLGYNGDNGVIVKGDMANTPAAGKLLPGDVVTQLQGKPIDNVKQLRDAIAVTAPGTTVSMSVYRNGKTQDVSVKIGEQPDNLDEVAQGRMPGSGQENQSNTVDALGIRLATPTEDQLDKYGLDHSTKGAMVTQVEPNSLADRYSIKVGDVITQVNDTPVANQSDAVAAIGKLDVNKGMRLYIQDNTGQRFVFVKAEKF
jgi:serine protease Do